MNTAKIKYWLTNKYLYIGIFAFLVVLFLIQNNRPVEISFLFWDIANANLFGILTLFFIIGGVTGYFGAKLESYKKRSSTKSFKSKSVKTPPVPEDEFAGKPLQ